MIADLNNLHFDLSKFTKIRELGRGRGGIVYLVENVDDGSLYALKEMYADECQSSITYVNREINVMIRLNHPSIVKFYGYLIDSEEEKVYILMQYAPNSSLLKTLTKARNGEHIPYYDNTAKQKILIGIARGMMHLHKNRLLHRDLKPDNIMLDGNFNPLIGDFGLSRDANDDENGYTQGVGTPIYNAPEKLETNEYGQSSDVYSFGIIMYEIVTNLFPFSELLGKIGGNVLKFSLAIIEKRERPKFPKNLDIPVEMKELIEQCWDANPDKRPSFEEIFHKLAYDSDELMSFKNLFENEKHKYYLNGIRQEEILSYVKELLDRENIEQYLIKQSITQLKEQVSSIKQDSEIVIGQIRTEIESIKNEVLSLQSNNQAQNELSKPTQLTTKAIDYNEGKYFEGILKYLTRLTGSNIHDNKKIRITTNSMHGDDYHYFFKNKNYYHPKNIVDYDQDNEYKSNDAGAAIICFDFKDKFIQLSKYAIQTTMNNNSTAHLKNWVIEVSKDGTDWFEIDRRRNDESLKGPGKSNVFSIQSPSDKFYRYIRLRQIGTSHCNSDNCNIFSICRMDFFGHIKEPQ